MGKQADDPHKTRLRHSAESRLKETLADVPVPRTEGDALKLLHELRVHQVELELQNEELRCSQEELEASRSRYSLLYDLAPVGYFTLTPDGTIRMANLVGASLLGKERSRLVNANFRGFIAEGYRPIFTKLLAKVFTDSNGLQTCELMLTERERPLFVQMHAAANESGGECLVAVTDISLRKQAEEALRKAHQELEQRVRERTTELAQSVARQQEEMTGRLEAIEELRRKDLLLIQQNRMAAVGEMLGNIAHQWRQPLNVLGLTLQQLGLSYELGGFSKELLDNNVAKSMEILRHLSQTIDVFRDFAIPDKEKSLFRLEDVIDKVLSLVRDSLQAHGITIEAEVTGHPQITGYPNEYSQVLLNLLMNTRDAFLESKKQEMRIRLRAWTERGKAVLTVTDNAGGIPKELLDRIFDAYFTTKPLGKGTGIGLFLAKGIIEKNMGGRLTARNVDGGAEFRIVV